MAAVAFVCDTLGAYPALSLSDARDKVQSYSALAREGLSPSEQDACQRAEGMTSMQVWMNARGLAGMG